MAFRPPTHHQTKFSFEAAPLWIPDEVWTQLSPTFERHTGRRWSARDRRVFTGVLYAYLTATPWMELPPGYGCSRTLYNQFHAWQRGGHWTRLWRAVLSVLPASCACKCHTHARKAVKLRATSHGRHARPVLPLPEIRGWCREHER